MNHTINTLIEAANNNIEEIFKHKQTLPRNNVSKTEKTIINKISKRDDLVFTKADKVGATAVLDIEKYEN